jgi:cytochrome c
MQKIAANQEKKSEAEKPPFWGKNAYNIYAFLPQIINKSSLSL